METTDGHEAKVGTYYYLENGQVVVLNNHAIGKDDKPAYLVTPFYEGEAMSFSGAGGEHSEITIDYEHEGLETLVFAIFENEPLDKLGPIYKVRLKEIENLSLSAGMLKSKSDELTKNLRKIEQNFLEAAKVLSNKQDEIENLNLNLVGLKEQFSEKRQELSDLQDAMPSGPSDPPITSNTVLVDKSELQKLRKNDFKMDCLEAGGLDNWEWYDESLKDFRERYPQ